MDFAPLLFYFKKLRKYLNSINLEKQTNLKRMIIFAVIM